MMESINNLRKEVAQMYEDGEAKHISDVCELESIALLYKELSDKEEFYKKLKKKREEDINSEIKKVSNKMDFLKSIILKTLQHHKEKSLKFPGVCNISSRKGRMKWSILDEEKFIKLVEQAIKEGEAGAGDVLKVVTNVDVVKKEADALLDSWDKNGKLKNIIDSLPEGEEICVIQEETKQSVAIKFEENIDIPEEPEDFEVSVPKKSEMNYDGI